MTDLVLLGGGGHCESVIEVLQQFDHYNLIGVLDPTYIEGARSVFGLPIVGTDDEIEQYVRKGCEFVITVGQIQSSRIREKLYHHVKDIGGRLPVIISKTAYVSRSAQLGEGTVVLNHAIVNVKGQTGRCCILNTGCLLEHGSSVGDFTHVSTKAVLNGEVRAGDRVFIGSGTIVNHGVTIGDDCIIASGSLVRKNLPSGTKAAGNPLRKFK